MMQVFWDVINDKFDSNRCVLNLSFKTRGFGDILTDKVIVDWILIPVSH